MEIEKFIKSSIEGESEYGPVLLNSLSVIDDIFLQALEKFEQRDSYTLYSVGRFFGDSDLRQTSYLDHFGSGSDDPEGGWTLLYQPKNRCIDLPGLSILFDGNMSLFWRVKNGIFEFDAMADR